MHAERSWPRLVCFGIQHGSKDVTLSEGRFVRQSSGSAITNGLLYVFFLCLMTTRIKEQVYCPRRKTRFVLATVPPRMQCCVCRDCHFVGVSGKLAPR
jgi:hypothetical protein